MFGDRVCGAVDVLLPGSPRTVAALCPNRQGNQGADPESSSEIATSAKEQSVGLAEVNTAVNAMDQTTQQNAAMVEQSNAASNTFANEAVRLRELVNRFSLAETSSAASRTLRPAQSTDVAHASPARAIGRKVAASFGNAALDTRSAQWSEF